jgi:hypothetical protein
MRVAGGVFTAWPAGLNSLEHQGAVGATKTKVVFDRYIDLHVSCGVGAIVQIALGVLVEDVNGGWAFLVVQCQHGEHAFNAASAAQ